MIKDKETERCRVSGDEAKEKLRRRYTDEGIKAVKLSFPFSLSMTKHNFEDDGADLTFKIK